MRRRISLVGRALGGSLNLRVSPAVTPTSRAIFPAMVILESKPRHLWVVRLGQIITSTNAANANVIVLKCLLLIKFVCPIFVITRQSASTKNQ